MIVDAALASALASALVPIVVCVAAGSAVGRGDGRWPGADMLVGFGLLGGALVLLAVATPLPLSWLMAALTVLSIAALAIRRQIPGGSTTWTSLALVLPILVHAANNQAAFWDRGAAIPRHDVAGHGGRRCGIFHIAAQGLGAMSVYEAATAADYWRYTPHLALLALYAPVMALATGRWPAG